MAGWKGRVWSHAVWRKEEGGGGLVVTTLHLNTSPAPTERGERDRERAVLRPLGRGKGFLQLINLSYHLYQQREGEKETERERETAVMKKRKESSKGGRSMERDLAQQRLVAASPSLFPCPIHHSPV